MADSDGRRAKLPACARHQCCPTPNSGRSLDHPCGSVGPVRDGQHDCWHQPGKSCQFQLTRLSEGCCLVTRGVRCPGGEVSILVQIRFHTFCEFGKGAEALNICRKLWELCTQCVCKLSMGYTAVLARLFFLTRRTPWQGLYSGLVYHMIHPLMMQFLSRPFVVGDRIDIASGSGAKFATGYVERVDPIYTVLRTDTGLPVTIPNKVASENGMQLTPSHSAVLQSRCSYSTPCTLCYIPLCLGVVSRCSAPSTINVNNVQCLVCLAMLAQLTKRSEERVLNRLDRTGSWPEAGMYLSRH